MHRSICAGSGRFARWTPGDNPIGIREILASRFAHDKSGGGTYFHRGRSSLDIGRNDRRYRSCARHGGARFRSRYCASGRQKIVVYHRRTGGQLQHSALLELDAKSDRTQSSLVYAKNNLHTPPSVEQLANAANLSPRQFSRAFRSETGQSPAKAVENMRVEATKMLMEQSRHPIDFVAKETGFADRERMRRAFLRAFGHPPQVIRRNAQTVMQS